MEKKPPVWVWIIVLVVIAGAIFAVEAFFDSVEDVRTDEMISAGAMEGAREEQRAETRQNESTTSTPNSSSMIIEEAKQDAVRVTMTTSKGAIQLDLFPKVAPKTVENFTKLASDGTYNDTAFHRVIADFMVQGGDPLTQGDYNNPQAGTGGPGYTFEDEINPSSIGVDAQTIALYEAQGYTYRDDLTSLPNVPGAISMANRGPGTNGSQFFIITESPQSHLDGKHTVFGEVVEGMDVVRSLVKGDVLQTLSVDE